MYEELVGDAEIIGADALAQYLASGGDLDELFELGDGDDGEVDPDVALLLAGDTAIGAAARKKVALASLPKSRTAALARAQLAKQAVAQIASRKAIGVRSRSLNTAGEIPVGINTGAVLASASAIVTITPPVIFKPKRLLVPETIAPGWTLDDVSVGLRNCLLTSQPVPAEVFSQVSVNQGWRIPTLQIGQAMSMTWTNQSGSTATLRAAWLGTYADV